MRFKTVFSISVGAGMLLAGLCAVPAARVVVPAMIDPAVIADQYIAGPVGSDVLCFGVFVIATVWLRRRNRRKRPAAARPHMLRQIERIV